MVFVGLAISEAWAGTPVLQTQSGAVVHWEKPILMVGLNPREASQKIAPTQVQQAISQAIAAWNYVQAGQPQLYLGEHGSFDIILSFCQTRWKGSKVDLGYSEFTAEPETGVLQSSVIEVNECDQTFYAPGEPAKGRHALVTVLAHELGHTLGLGHSNNRSSVMFPTGGGSGLPTHHSEDTEALAAIYLGRFPKAMVLPKGRSLGRTTSVDKPIQGIVPEDATVLLSIRSHNGRALMVYTSQPTLLPPLEPSQPQPRLRKLRQGKAKR